MPHLRDQHIAIRDAIREFIAGECPEELIRDNDNAHHPPLEQWGQIAELGWMGWSIEESYGGLGGDLLGLTVIAEELCRGYLALGTLYVNSAFSSAYSIGLYGTPEQKQFFLPRLAAGEIIFAAGFTEPDAGQDLLGGLRTRAKLEGDEYVVSGQKVFTTHASIADYILLLARTSEGERRSEGLSLLVVDAKSEGLTINRMDEVVMRGNPSCEVFLDEVRVPADRLLGSEGAGWMNGVKTLDVEKIVVAAMAVGNAQAALDYAVSYALERHAFGGPIGRFQALQQPLADAAVQIEASRLLVREAAALFDAGEPYAKPGLLAKVAASEAGLFATDVGMRVLAGYGHVTEYPAQRYFRDARVYQAGPITNEMARNQIAQSLGLPRSY